MLGISQREPGERGEALGRLHGEGPYLVVGQRQGVDAASEAEPRYFSDVIVVQIQPKETLK